MPYGSRRGNPVVAALYRRDIDPRPPLQVANGTRADTMPGPQVASEAPAEAVRQAWLPVTPGQLIPMLGEAVFDDEPGFDE
jgi:hypothetical protein